MRAGVGGLAVFVGCFLDAERAARSAVRARVETRACVAGTGCGGKSLATCDGDRLPQPCPED